MSKKILIAAAFQAVIAFLIGIYVESVSSGELLFTKGILSEGIREGALKHPLKVLFVLLCLNLACLLIVDRGKDNRQNLMLYNNICRQIFESYIKQSNNYENSKFRVSLFKVKKGFLWMNWGIVCYPSFNTTYLKNVGRHQTRQPMRLSNVKFLSGQGAVGNCYSLGEFVFFETEQFQSDVAKYAVQQLQKTRLPMFKGHRIKDRSCSFVCCPVKFFSSDELFGVIVVDCMVPNHLREEEFRSIENVISQYSVIFTKEHA